MRTNYDDALAQVIWKFTTLSPAVYTQICFPE
jgi:hypothetical protein